MTAVAVVVVRDGRLPVGAAEAADEAGGQVVLVGSGTRVAADGLTGAVRVRCFETGPGFRPAALARALAPVLAPDALVVGYSHRPGDAGTTPNAWLLAQRGAVVERPDHVDPFGALRSGQPPRRGTRRDDEVVSAEQLETQAKQRAARAAHDVASRLPVLAKTPVFVGVGRYDIMAPPANAEAIAKLTGAARFEVYEGGHLFFFQDPRAFGDLDSFLH